MRAHTANTPDRASKTVPPRLVRIIPWTFDTTTASTARGITKIMIQVLTATASSAPLSSSGLSSLWSSLTALQWAAAISAAILTIGAIIEYWEKLKLLTLLLAKWIFRRLSPLDRCLLRKLLIHSLGPILVVLGIAGDFVFEGRAFILEDRQEDKSQATIATLKEHTASLEASAATNEKVAQTARKEADELELLVSPRRLTLEQQNAVAASCAGFLGKGVTVSSYEGDSEAMGLGEQIASALATAHVVSIPNFGSLGTAGDLLQGVQITGSNRKLVSCIESSLQNAGLKITSPNKPQIPPGSAAVFHGAATPANVSVEAGVFVGVKPFVTLPH